jgi:hypothetical protein
MGSFQRLWSRGYPTTRTVVVKATSSAARAAPALLDRSAAARGVYLNVAAEPYLATLLAGANSPLDLRGHAAERMRRLQAQIRAPLRPVHELSPGELAAMSWLAESLTQRETLSRHPERILRLDFDRLLADVPGTLRQVLVQLRLPDDPLTVERIIRGPVLSRYSKAPEHAYGPEQRATLLNDARRIHREEIARGMRWLEEIARTEPAAAAVLLRS